MKLYQEQIKKQAPKSTKKPRSRLFPQVCITDKILAPNLVTNVSDNGYYNKPKKLLYHSGIKQKYIPDTFPSQTFIQDPATYFNTARKKRVFEDWLFLAANPCIYKSQTNAAKANDCERETVNRDIKQFTQDGLMNKVTRGIYQTCCYRISSFFFDPGNYEKMKKLFPAVMTVYFLQLLSLQNTVQRENVTQIIYKDKYTEKGVSKADCFSCQMHIRTYKVPPPYCKQCHTLGESMYEDNPYLNSPTQGQKPGSYKNKTPDKREGSYQSLSSGYPFTVYKGFTSPYQLEILSEAARQKSLDEAKSISKTSAVQQLRERDMLAFENEPDPTPPPFDEDEVWQEVFDF